MITTFSTEVLASTLAAATRLLRGFFLASIRMPRTTMGRVVAMRAGIFAVTAIGTGRVDDTYTCHLDSMVDPDSCPKQTRARTGLIPKYSPEENRERTGRTGPMLSDKREPDAQRIREESLENRERADGFLDRTRKIGVGRVPYGPYPVKISTSPIEMVADRIEISRVRYRWIASRANVYVHERVVENAGRRTLEEVVVTRL